MNAEEKIEYVLNKVREQAKINPSGMLYIDYTSVGDYEANGPIPDEVPIILSQIDQINILKKFHQDNLIHIWDWEKDHKGVWISIVDLDKKPDEKPSEFLDEEAQIKVDGFTLQLPPYKNEHAFCRAMFRYKVNEPVEWDIIYEEISGINKSIPNNERDRTPDQNKRTVSDTMRSINERIEQNRSSELFKRSDNTYRRLR
jgi:hypothetical protein